MIRILIDLSQLDINNSTPNIPFLDNKIEQNPGLRDCLAVPG